MSSNGRVSLGERQREVQVAPAFVTASDAAAARRCFMSALGDNPITATP
jgi:hypothetical protein